MPEAKEKTSRLRRIVRIGEHMTESNVEQIQTAALALQANRQALRAQKPLWVRLREATDRARLLSTVPSAGISEYTTSGKSEDREPPAQQEVDISERLALVSHAVELLEAHVDAECGLSAAAREFTSMSMEEKDKELLKWRGVKSWEVCTRAPYLGKTPRTIERARERLELRPSDGMPKVPKVIEFKRRAA